MDAATSQDFSIDAAFDFADFTLPSGLHDFSSLIHPSSPADAGTPAAASDAPMLVASVSMSMDALSSPHAHAVDADVAGMHAILAHHAQGSLPSSMDVSTHHAVAAARAAQHQQGQQQQQRQAQQGQQGQKGQQEQQGQQEQGQSNDQQQAAIEALQRALEEKERMDELQALRTRELRKQLEQLQMQNHPQVSLSLARPHHQHHHQPGLQPATSQFGSPNPFVPAGMQGNISAPSSPAFPDSLHASAPAVSQAHLVQVHHSPHSFIQQQPSQHQHHHHHHHAASMHLTSQPQLAPSGFSPTPSSSGVVNQYGLNTPAGSGPMPVVGTSFIPNVHAFGEARQKEGGQDVQSFTPLGTPLMTPASVFSNASVGGATPHYDFLSPLSSPALMPQQGGGGGTPQQQQEQQHHLQAALSALSSPMLLPMTAEQQAALASLPAPPGTASPHALTARPGGPSSSRPKRTATAEAKAAKARPSPLIKPQTGRSRKRSDAAGLSSPALGPGGVASASQARRRSVSAEQQQQQQQQMVPSPNMTATPSSFSQMQGANAGSAVYAPRVRASVSAASAEPSPVGPHASEEGDTTSTPSPIDLNLVDAAAMPPPQVPSSKPLTPASIMGIGFSSSSSSPSSSSVAGGRMSAPGAVASTSPAASSAGGVEQTTTVSSPAKAGRGSSAPSSAKAKAKAKAVTDPTPVTSLPTTTTAGSCSGTTTHFRPIAPSTAAPAARSVTGPKARAGNSRGDRDAWMSSPSFPPPSSSPSSSSKTNNAHMASSSAGNAAASDGLESRRSSHKMAEQKRRDSLKHSFDELRALLPVIHIAEDTDGATFTVLGPDGGPEDEVAERFDRSQLGPAAEDVRARATANKGVSKVALLRHSNEYLVRCRKRIGRREMEIGRLRAELGRLRARLEEAGLPVPEELPSGEEAGEQRGDAAGGGGGENAERLGSVVEEEEEGEDKKMDLGRELVATERNGLLEGDRDEGEEEDREEDDGMEVEA